jgi:hemerythrin-like domain-containing protein
MFIHVFRKALRQQWIEHRMKEERCLLPYLTSYVDTEKGPLAIMKVEHAQIDEVLILAEEQLRSYLQNKDAAWILEESFTYLRKANELNMLHCSREEKSIFVLAQLKLNDTEKKMLHELVKNKHWMGEVQC